MADHYEVLGVARDASQEQIKKAYRKLYQNLKMKNRLFLHNRGLILKKNYFETTASVFIFSVYPDS